MRPSNWVLIGGLIVLLAGIVLSLCDVDPYADWTLAVGAVIVLIRGFIRTHERDDEQEGKPMSEDD